MICKIISKNDNDASIELMNGYIKKVPLSTLPENSSIGELITMDEIQPRNMSNESIPNFI